MANNIGIVFSGGCYSGKTTAIQKMVDAFGKENCIVLQEAIREKLHEPIDEIRGYPGKYLQLQKEVIDLKINQEKFVFKNHENKIILVDRALSDSLFYLTFYLDKNALYINELKELNKLYNHLLKEANNSFESYYDFVLNFSPLQKPCADVYFRPEKIEQLKNIEHQLISTFSYGISNSKNYKYQQIIDVNLNNEFSGNLSLNRILFNRYDDFAGTYSLYDSLIQGFYTLDNTYSNVSKSYFVNKNEIDYNGKTFVSMLMSSMLFTDTKRTDDIFDLIKAIEIDKEFMNSRSYPTGYFSEGNIMVVGEAPGKSGRAVNNDWLKPSFIFERTSYILRKAIYESAPRLNYQVPYITNLCKYANSTNDLTNDDFKKCFDIFKKEVELLQPRKIICLGKKTYNYLKDRLAYPDELLISLPHPAFVLYGGMQENDFIKQFKKAV